MVNVGHNPVTDWARGTAFPTPPETYDVIHTQPEVLMMTTLEKVRRLEQYIAVSTTMVDPVLDMTIDKLLTRATTRMLALKARLASQLAEFEEKYALKSAEFIPATKKARWATKWISSSGQLPWKCWPISRNVCHYWGEKLLDESLSLRRLRKHYRSIAAGPKVRITVPAGENHHPGSKYPRDPHHLNSHKRRQENHA